MSGAMELAVFCLGTGAAMGCLFLLFKAVRIVLGAGKVLTAVMDVVFCCVCAVVIFLCALAIANGRLRLYQAVGQGVGAWAAVTLLDGAVVRAAKFLAVLGERFVGVFNKCFAFLCAGFRRKKRAARKKQKNSKEKQQKAAKRT